MDLSKQNLRVACPQDALKFKCFFKFHNVIYSVNKKNCQNYGSKNTHSQSNASGKEDYIPWMTVFVVGRFMMSTFDFCNLLSFVCHSEQQQKEWNYDANQSVLINQIPDLSV